MSWMRHFILLFGIALALANVECAYDMNTPFINNATLVAPDQYLLYWNYTTTDIVFKLVVKNTKWLGFGFSNNGDMDYADIVVAFFNADGSANFTGRSILEAPTMYVDPVQHVRLLYMSSQNNFTTVIFTRKIRLCANSTNSTDINLDIISGTQYMIYAWGNSFAGNGDITYHGSKNRGSIVLSLITTLNEVVNLNMNQTKTVDFNISTTLISNSTTEYFCSMFKLPTEWLNTKQHILRYETIYPDTNSEYVHHWLLYECSDSYEKVYLNQTNGTHPDPGTCFPIDQYQQPNEWLNAAQYCQRISLLWGVGSPNVYDFPSNMAYPMGGPGSFKYFYLQLHYHNPNHDQNAQGDMTLRLYHTQTYRPIELGVLTVGTDSGWHGIIIPPKMPKLSIDYYCRKEALQGWFSEKDNLTVIGVVPHTHLAGIQVFLKQIRNGQEINYLTKAEQYNFNFQAIQFLQKPIVVSKNDELKSTCVYQSMDKTGFTLGGVATTDEMCLNFVWYYPRNPKYSACYEIPSVADSYIFASILNSTNEIQINGSLNENSIHNALKNAKPTASSSLWIVDYYAKSNRTDIFDANNTANYRDYTPYTVLPIMEPSCVVSNARVFKSSWSLISLILCVYLILKF